MDLLPTDAKLGGTPITLVKAAGLSSRGTYTSWRALNYETIIQDLHLKKAALLEHDVCANFHSSALAFLSSSIDRMERLRGERGCPNMDSFFREQLQDEIEHLRTEASLRQYQRQQFHIYVDTMVGMVSISPAPEQRTSVPGSR